MWRFPSPNKASIHRLEDKHVHSSNAQKGEEEEADHREKTIQLLLAREEYQLLSRELTSLSPQDLAGELRGASLAFL